MGTVTPDPGVGASAGGVGLGEGHTHRFVYPVPNLGVALFLPGNHGNHLSVLHQWLTGFLPKASAPKGPLPSCTSPPHAHS